MQIHKSGLSKINKLITLVWFIVIALIIISISLTDWGQTRYWIILLICCCASLFAYGFSLQKVVYNKGGNIVLKRLFSSYRIPLKEIKSVDLFKGNVPMTFSTKGVFGNNGTSMDGTLCYINDTSNMILLKTESQNFVFSCNERELLINAINTEISAE